MNPLLLEITIPVAGFGLVMGGAIGWDRLREPFRDPWRNAVVRDRRTFKRAGRRIERLLEIGEPDRARYVVISAVNWLTSQTHIGRPARRARYGRLLGEWNVRYASMAEQWELRLMGG